MRLSQVEKKAKSMGIKDTWKFSKKELIKAIREKETIILKTGVGNSIEKRQGNQYKTYFNRHIN